MTQNGSPFTPPVSRRQVFRWAGVSVAAVGAAQLAGCAPSSTTGSASSANPVTIRYSGPGMSSDSADRTVLDAFTKATGDKISYLGAADTATWASTLRAQISAGNAPDVFQTAPGAAGGSGMAVQPLAKAGFLLDLSDRPWAKDVPSAVGQVAKFDGKFYSANTLAGTIPAFYNVAHLEKVGASVPTTLDEFKSLCAELKAAGMVPITQGLGDKWPAILLTYALVATMEYGATPDFETQRKDNKLKFEGSGWQHALEVYKQFNDAGYIGEGGLGRSYSDALNQVASAQATMTVAVSQSLVQLKKNSKDAQLSSFPIPGGAAASDTVVPYGLAYGQSVYVKGQNIQTALRLIDFMMEPAQVQLGMSGGNLPVSISDKVTVDPVLDRSYAIAKTGKSTPYPDPFWPSQTVQDALMAGTQDMLLGKSTPVDVVKAMDAAYDAANK